VVEPPYDLARAARRIGVSRAWLVDLVDAGEAAASTVRTPRGPVRQFSAAEVERLRKARVEASLKALGEEWDAKYRVRRHGHDEELNS